MKFGPQTAYNWTVILPTLHKFYLLPGFTDEDQLTKLNQNLPNGGQ